MAKVLLLLLCLLTEEELPELKIEPQFEKKEKVVRLYSR
jgi:hypothetical protein